MVISAINVLDIIHLGTWLTNCLLLKLALNYGTFMLVPCQLMYQISLLKYILSLKYTSCGLSCFTGIYSYRYYDVILKCSRFVWKLTDPQHQIFSILFTPIFDRSYFPTDKSFPKIFSR